MTKSIAQRMEERKLQADDCRFIYNRFLLGDREYAELCNYFKSVHVIRQTPAFKEPFKEPGYYENTRKEFAGVPVEKSDIGGVHMAYREDDRITIWDEYANTTHTSRVKKGKEFQQEMSEQLKAAAMDKNPLYSQLELNRKELEEERRKREEEGKYRLYQETINKLNADYTCSNGYHLLETVETRRKLFLDGAQTVVISKCKQCGKKVYETV